jgi:hypothetical protein
VRAILIICLLGLTGCAQTIQQSAQQKALDDTKAALTKCFADIRATPEGQLLSKRLWQADSTDTAAKLSDPKPLTQAEKDALVSNHTKSIECRRLADDWANHYALYQLPAMTELYARSDAIFTKLVNGGPVSEANKASIASSDQFQADLAHAGANAAAVQEQNNAMVRAQAAQGLAAAMIGAQPRMTTTNCVATGNTLNCNGMR